MLRRTGLRALSRRGAFARRPVSAPAALALTGVLTLALALAAALAGCAAPGGGGEGGSAATGHHGGRLVVGATTDVDAWNEYVSREAPSRSILRRIWLPLAEERVRADGSSAFEPVLADSWSFADEGRTLTFRLRPAVWSDGRPLTADDVVFTWQAQTSPEVPWVGAPSKSDIESVEAPDDSTVVFRFASASPWRLAQAVEGGILPRHAYGSIPFADWATHDWSTGIVGSGPFLLDEYRPAERIVLRRNERCLPDQAAHLDEVVVLIVPDVDSLLTQLRTGEVDLLTNVPPREAGRLKDDPDVGVLPYPFPDITAIGWNERRPPFDEPDVRTAMTLAIDRRALIDETLYGFGRVAAGPVPSMLRGADPTLAPLPFDRERARELLRRHGIAVRLDDGSTTPGSPLAFDLNISTSNVVRQTMAVKIQAQLAAIGVEARVTPMEMSTLGGRIMHGDFDAYLLGTVLQVSDVPTIYGSDQGPPQGANYLAYSSPDADAAIAAMGAARTWDELQPALDELQRVVVRDQPQSFVFEAERIAAYGPRVGHVTIDVPSDPLARLASFTVSDR